MRDEERERTGKLNRRSRAGGEKRGELQVESVVGVTSSSVAFEEKESWEVITRSDLRMRLLSAAPQQGRHVGSRLVQTHLAT